MSNGQLVSLQTSKKRLFQRAPSLRHVLPLRLAAFLFWQRGDPYDVVELLNLLLPETMVFLQPTTRSLVLPHLEPRIPTVVSPLEQSQGRFHGISGLFSTGQLRL